eukprot:4155910-Prymnesium_polylepis.1
MEDQLAAAPSDDACRSRHGSFSLMRRLSRGSSAAPPSTEPSGRSSCGGASSDCPTPLGSAARETARKSLGRAARGVASIGGLLSEAAQ